MDSENAILALAALAQPTRLDVFRLLVRHEPEGLAAGDIAKALAVPQNTMSSHLSILSRAGLVSARRFSRSIVYRADLTRLQAVVLFMLKDCCDGRPEICTPLVESLTPCVRPSRKSALMQNFDLPRRLTAEALGTALLVATVVGSGIMAESLTRDVALALLGKHAPTGAILVVLITILGPISGAHFNPAVTLIFALKRELTPRDALLYIVVQIAGGIVGTMMAHAMFALPLLDASLKMRTGGAQWLAESVAAFVCRNHSCRRSLRALFRALAGRPLHHGGLLVYIVDVVCDPAVAIARSMTNTFSGIRPTDLPASSRPNSAARSQR